MTTIRGARSTFSNLPRLLVDCVKRNDLETCKRINECSRACDRMRGQPWAVSVSARWKWIGVWLYAMYLISFYYYCYYDITFTARCHTVPAQSSISCGETQAHIPSQKNQRRPLRCFWRAHRLRDNRRKGRKTQDERRTEHCRRRQSVEDEWKKRIRRTWCSTLWHLVALPRRGEPACGGNVAPNNRKERPAPTEFI